ncbi:unnamed protein product, partial [Dibothriocephalus latus]
MALFIRLDASRGLSKGTSEDLSDRDNEDNMLKSSKAPESDMRTPENVPGAFGDQEGVPIYDFSPGMVIEDNEMQSPPAAIEDGDNNLMSNLINRFVDDVDDLRDLDSIGNQRDQRHTDASRSSTAAHDRGYQKHKKVEIMALFDVDVSTDGSAIGDDIPTGATLSTTADLEVVRANLHKALQSGAEAE